MTPNRKAKDAQQKKARRAQLKHQHGVRSYLLFLKPWQAKFAFDLFAELDIEVRSPAKRLQQEVASPTDLTPEWYSIVRRILTVVQRRPVAARKAPVDDGQLRLGVLTQADVQTPIPTKTVAPESTATTN